MRCKINKFLKSSLLVILFFYGLSLFSEEKYEIVVLGTRIPFKFDTKRQVLIIEKEALRNIPANNLVQLIALCSNINFLNRGQFQADANFSGFNQEQVLVMVDGIPFNNAQTGHHNFNLPFEIEQVERIEIIKGGVSSLYGPSGAGGVINIITTKNKLININIGSFNTQKYSLNWNYKNINLQAGRISTAGYMKGIDGKKSFVKMGVDLYGKKSHLNLWGAFNSDNFGAYKFYSPYPSYEKLNKFAVNLLYDQQVKKSLSLCIQSSLQASRDEFQLFRDNPNYYLNDHHTFQNSLEIGIKNFSKNLAYYGGISVLYDRINSVGQRNGVLQEALGQHNRTSFSFFSEASFEKSKFFLSPGIRYTVGSYHHLSSNINGGFYIHHKTKVLGSIYNSFRVPTYTELYYQDPSHLSNPNLKLETSWGGEIGLIWQNRFGEWGSKIFKIAANNLIDWSKGKNESIWISRNIKKAEFEGVELNYSLHSSQNMLKIAYSYQKICLSSQSNILINKYNYYFPEHNLSILGKIEKNNLFFSTALKIEIQKKDAHPYLNCRVGLNQKNYSIYFDILNIFNERIEKIPGLPEAPRSCSATLALHF
jgi:iron complex outermembrane receptor protein